MDLAAYLRSRQTGMVGTSALTSLPHDLDYLVSNMHPLTWAYKWSNCKANFTYHPRQGPSKQLQAEEPVCLLVWMDKKYKTEDKKVVFITNCLPAIPTSPQIQCHWKNIRDSNYHYNKQLITSPPILKAYNHRMGGVDRHNRLVEHHAIHLTSTRGYLKIFFHILDTTVVNAWILFKTAKEARGEWNEAAKRRHTLAWFKESVILSLCGNYSYRKHIPSVKLANTILPIQSMEMITRHQIQPVTQIQGFEAKPGQCVICKKLKRTACRACKQRYCYECGRKHLHELLLQHTRYTPVNEEELASCPQSNTNPSPNQTSESGSDSEIEHDI